MGLALRNGFADLESPLPQAGLDQQNSKFNALAYHNSRSICAHVERSTRRRGPVQDIFNRWKFGKTGRAEPGKRISVLRHAGTFAADCLPRAVLSERILIAFGTPTQVAGPG
jgi:hypothetical protein